MRNKRLKDAYGLSRSRDKKGNIVRRRINPYVNCLHTQVGGARVNMEVYVVEVYKEEGEIYDEEQEVRDDVGAASRLCK